MRRRDRRADLAPGIGEEAQRPGRGDGRVELTQRAGGGVARVGEDFAARLPLPLVQRGEVGAGHVDLAPDLEDIGRARNPVGDVLQRAQVGGDVLAGVAVAAGGADGEPAALVAQRDRQAVDLRLRHHLQRCARIAPKFPEKTPHALDELDQIRLGEGVGERQHRPRVLHLGEAGGGRSADLARGRVVADERGKARLDRRIAQAQRVVLGIADDRRVLLMVGAVVRGDLGGERRQLLGRLLRRQILDGEQAQRRAHAGEPASRLSAAARASAVTRAPASIRAISSLRPGGSSTSTAVRACFSPTVLAMRQ